VTVLYRKGGVCNRPELARYKVRKKNKRKEEGNEFILI
jgi:hypothetical protein